MMYVQTSPWGQWVCQSGLSKNMPSEIQILASWEQLDMEFGMSLTLLYRATDAGGYISEV